MTANAEWICGQLRDEYGRFAPRKHDPRHPWVLVDTELREPVIRCSTRNECREYQREAGGRILRTMPERRRTET